MSGALGSMLGEDLHAFLLRADEAVLLVRLVADGRGRVHSLRPGQRGGEGCFHLGLFGPANLVGGKTKITGGDEIDLVFLSLGCLAMAGSA